MRWLFTERIIPEEISSKIKLVILDCGVRINELLNVAIDDYNSKDKIIKIGGETAKTRESRIFSIIFEMIGLDNSDKYSDANT